MDRTKRSRSALYIDYSMIYPDGRILPLLMRAKDGKALVETACRCGVFLQSGNCLKDYPENKRNKRAGGGEKERLYLRAREL